MRSWAGSLTVDLSNRIGVLKKDKLGWFFKSFAELSIDASCDLFVKMQRPSHCLNHLFV